MRLGLIGCLLFCLLHVGLSQQVERILGSPFIQNFKPKEYKGEPQVNCLAKDSRGVLYFGHNSGLSVFNGAEWTSVNVNDKGVMTIVISNEDRIIVGSEGEFGEVVSTESGEMEYKCLSCDLDFEIQTIHGGCDVGTTLYLSDYGAIYGIDENGISRFEHTAEINDVFAVDDQLYVYVVGEGLQYVDEGGKFQKHPGDGKIDTLKVNQVMPLGDDSLLVISPKAMYTTHADYLALKVYGDNLTEKSSLICGLYNPKENECFVGNVGSGIARINSSGLVEEVYDQDNGLISNSIKKILLTNDNQLAVCTNNGISFIDVYSPIRKVGKTDGVHGPLEGVFGDEICYVAGREGVFIYDRKSKYPFQEIDNLNQESFGGGIVDSSAVFVMYDGLYQLQNRQLIEYSQDYAWSLYQYNDNILVVGGDYYCAVYSRENKQSPWEELSYFDVAGGQVKSLVVDLDGNVWAGVNRGTGGVYRLTPVMDELGKIIDFEETFYGEERVGAEGDVYVFNVGQEVLFGTKKGVLEYRIADDVFVKTDQLGVGIDELSKEITVGYEDTQGRVWLSVVESKTVRNIGYVKDNQFVKEPFKRLNDNLIYSVHADAKNVVWLAGPEGLFRYEHKDFDRFEYPVFCSSISLGDSTLFYGNVKDDQSFLINKLNHDLVFPYQKKSLKFTFAAPTFAQVSATKYQFFLEGFDDRWSDWSAENQVNYTNLPEGDYVLHCKAINARDEISQEATISFVVLPPWYRTWWFRLLVVMALVGVVYLLFRARTASLKKRQKELEQTVEERTREVVEEKKEVERQKHLVDEKNQEISDSINYAERIQRSMLANKKLMDGYLDEYFIFFKPKDVVSGDFYWASEIEGGKLAVVNADSTGHGVPGAIMSMLNMNSLKESVKLGLTAPHEILNETRKIIKETLKNDGSEEGGKDGMDCSLLLFEKGSNELVFAAANNPVWIVRDGELIEFKGDKMPVGKHDKDNQSFSTQTTELKAGDMIYTLTDGMPDQFGGPKGKKFMYKRLKNLLVEVSTKPMNEQQGRLQDEFESWRGQEEQVDDVCIIGVRV